MSSGNHITLCKDVIASAITILREKQDRGNNLTVREKHILLQGLHAMKDVLDMVQGDLELERKMNHDLLLDKGFVDPRTPTYQELMRQVERYKEIIGERDEKQESASRLLRSMHTILKNTPYLPQS